VRERRERRPTAAASAIAAAGIAAAIFAPFFRLAPNRIVRGEPLFLSSAAPLLLGVLVLVWLAFALASGSERRALAEAAAWLPFLAAALYLVAAALACRRGAAAGPASRIGLASGFWLGSLVVYLAYVISSRRAKSPGWIGAIGALALLAFAAALLLAGSFDRLALVKEWGAQRDVFAAELTRHLSLAGGAVLAGGILGAGIGAAAARSRAVNSVGFLALNVVQTIPSLALFGFLIIPLAALVDRFPTLRDLGIGGIGPAPALIALSLYAALPVARNTLAALEAVPASVRDAGMGMGMGRTRLFLKVELPLALPVALAGLRTAAVQAVGNTAVAALIGAGGLGVFIFQGLGQFAMDMVLLGTLPLVAMALLVDVVFGALVAAATPKAFSGAAKAAEAKR